MMQGGAAVWHSDRAPMRLRVAAVLLAVLAGIAALLWVLPWLLDWSSYRGIIAGYASRELGRPVRIDGPIRVTLLPTPLLTAADVRLGDAGDGITLTAPALRLGLSLTPLLLGRVVPQSLVLSGATIALPWPLPQATLAAVRPDWLAGSSARIERGTLTLGELKFSELNAELSSGAEPGGLAIGGTARAFGQFWRFSNRLGAPDALGDTPVEATLDAEARRNQPAAGAGAKFVGTLAHDGSLAGRVAAHAADLSLLLPAPPVAGEANGTIGLGGQGPARADLHISIGTVVVEARLRPQNGTSHQVLSLTAGRLDLDAWDAALARLRAGQNAAGMILLPAPVSLDLAADAVSLRGGLIRGVHAALDVDGRRGVLKEATALLPGGAALRAQGTLIEDVFGLTLAGRGTLDAPRLRDTLAWLQACGLKLGSFLPDNVLRTANLDGAVTARRDGVQLSAITGTLDGSAVTGKLEVDTASGALTADLGLDRLELDNWITPGATADWRQIGPGFAGMDLALKLRARATRFRGRTIDALSLDAGSSAGGVMINRLDATYGGLHGRVSGTIGADGGVSQAQFDLTAPHAGTLASFLPQGVHVADYLWSGPVRLHAEATGPQDALIASIGLDLADARLEAHPTIDLATGAWSARLTLRHPGAPRLLDALGLPQARNWLGEGSLSLLAQVSGTPDATRLDNFDVTAGTLHATGDLQWSSSNALPSLTGHIAADTLPLPAFAPHGTAPIPLGWLAGWTAKLALSAAQVNVGDTALLQNAAAALTLDSGVLTLENLRAAIGGGTVTGAATLDSAATPPRLTARAAIAGATVTSGLFAAPLDFGTGVVDAKLDLSAAGYSPAAMTASLAGTAGLTAANVTLTGIDLAAARAAPDRLALTAGATRFDQAAAAATVANGIATLARTTLAGPDGALNIDGAIDLPAAKLNLGLQLPGQAVVRLSGSLAAPRRAVRAVVR